jgi:hypothetical protein
LQIKKYGGEFREQMPNFSTKDEKYPVVFVEPVSDLEDLNTNQFSINVYCVDIIQKDRANLNTIVSDCQLILKDLYVYYINDMDAQLDVVGTSTMTPVNNFDSDYVAGWVMSITFEVSTYGACEIPMNPIEPVEVICEPGTVENSDGSYTATVASGGLLILPDVRLVIYDEDGNVLSDEMYPSVTDQDITVTIPPCADSTINVNSNLFDTAASGGTLNVPVVNSGSNPIGTIVANEVVIGNSVININTIQVGDVSAEDTLSINVTLNGSNSGTWNPGSQTWEVVAAAVPVGATLMKTGQTTSYRTGDDGDLEAGRATSFTVLASNNPFGNTNRFTDELGGQTYTKNIVIDWSTYNGTNVLGYKRTLRAVGINWNNAIDESIALSFGGFTSGWRMCNIKEYQNLYNYGVNYASPLNYSPFNIQTNILFLWTANTLNGQTTDAYYLSNNGTQSFIVKTFATNITYISCRTFTVTGTTLS